MPSQENVSKNIKTFSEAGRGRKKCPDCSIFVPAICKTCVCGFSFASKIKEKKSLNVTTYTEGGRGKKQCPECKKYVGAKTAVCFCEYKFEGSTKPVPKPLIKDIAKAEKENRLPINPMMLGCRHSIIAPAGACPCKLTSTEREHVEDWADRVRKTFHQQSLFLTLSGLIYFITQFYSYHSEEYNTVRNHLEDFLGHERSFGVG